jgi:hypothetical protein
MEAPTNAASVRLRYRGRGIGPAEVEQIRAAIAAREGRGRTEIARRLCEQWNWRQPNGALKVCACRDLLLRLEERGLVQLPPRGAGRRGASQHSLAGYPLPVYPWPLERADLDTLVLRVITAEERLGWRILVDRFHYLRDKPIVGEHLLYAAYVEEQVVACVAWASAARHCGARDRYVGWDEATKQQRLHLVAANVRFLVVPWVRVKCLASKILAANLRCLAADWRRVWGHPVWLAETFVDRARFAGTCYRASNWRYVGDSKGQGKRGMGYVRHGHPKAVYLYPLHRRWQQELLSAR